MKQNTAPAPCDREDLPRELTKQARRLRDRFRTAYLLRDAVGWTALDVDLERADRRDGTDTARNLLNHERGNERAEELDLMAEQLHRLRSGVETVAGALKEESEESGAQTRKGLAEDLRRIAGQLRGLYHRAGTVRAALRREHAVAFLREAKAPNAGEPATVEAQDVRTEAESPPAVKLLGTFTGALFDDAEWIEDLAGCLEETEQAAA